MRQRQALGAFDQPIGKGIVFAALFAQHAQQEPGRKQPHGGARDLLFGDHAQLQGAQDMLIGAAAIEVAAQFQRQLNGLRRRGGHTMVFVEVPDRPAVGNEVPLKAPFPAKLSHKIGARTAGLPVESVVGAHDGLHALVHQGAECWEIGFLQILLRYAGIEPVSKGLGTAVGRKVLGAGGNLQSLALALQPADEGAPQPRGERRVLPVGLLAAAPARIAEDVHIGRPQGQAMIDVSVPLSGEGVVFSPCLVGDHGSDLLHELFVEHGGEADGLGEAGSGAAPGQAVQPLVPPVVGGNPQPLDGGRVKAKLSGLFLHGHAADQCFSKLSRPFARHTSFSLRLYVSPVAGPFPLRGAAPAR